MEMQLCAPVFNFGYLKEKCKFNRSANRKNVNSATGKEAYLTLSLFAKAIERARTGSPVLENRLCRCNYNHKKFKI
jgi:hypothetical protein